MIVLAAARIATAAYLAAAAYTYQGTIELVNEPHYGETAEFYVTLDRPWKDKMKLATWCSDADSYTGAESIPIPKYTGKHWEGIRTMVMSHPTWQPPMSCFTGVFLDRPQRKHDRYITDSVHYMVLP